MNKTKIVATIGPASCSENMLGQFVDAGVDVIRFNMSHGQYQEHQQTLDTLRKIAAQRGVNVATLADLCGPKVRTSEIQKEHAHIQEGESCTIVRESMSGSARMFSTNYPDLVDDVQVGHRVLIDDGQIRMIVTEKSMDSLVCRCEIGGRVGSHKGINVPDSHLSLSTLSEKDLEDLQWAIENQFDYVALSFVRHVDDIQLLRIAIKKAKGDIPIIAKIETPQAIQSLDEIIKASDAVLVARGDLGVEMDVWRIPMLQKDMIRRCRRMGKPVIVATQMLHSMVESATPTRAEVSDVANAVLDGADAVMLSAESAVGKYPVQAVTMLQRISEQALQDHEAPKNRRTDIVDQDMQVGREVDQTSAAVARSAALVAHDLQAKLIVVWCRSGQTARWLSKYRCRQTIITLSSNEAVCRRMALCYGIKPMLIESTFEEGRSPWNTIEQRIVSEHKLQLGDMYVVVGDPTAQHRASTLSIHVVGD